MDEPTLGPSLGPNEHNEPTGGRRVGWEKLPPRPTKSILKREIDKIHQMREHMDGRLEELKQHIWEEVHAPSPEEQKRLDPESVRVTVRPRSVAGVNIDYDKIIRGVKEAIEKDRAKQKHDEEDSDEVYEAVERAAMEMLDKADAARAEANAMLNRVAGARGKPIEPAARQLLGQIPTTRFTEEATNHKECSINCSPLRRCCHAINPCNWTPSKWSRKRWVTVMSVLMVLVAAGAAYGMYYWACNYGGLDMCKTNEPTVDYYARETIDELCAATGNPPYPPPIINGTTKSVDVFGKAEKGECMLLACRSESDDGHYKVGFQCCLDTKVTDTNRWFNPPVLVSNKGWTKVKINRCDGFPAPAYISPQKPRRRW